MSVGNYLFEKATATNTAIALSVIIRDIKRISLVFRISSFIIALGSIVLHLFKGDFILINCILLVLLLGCTALKVALKDNRAKRRIVKWVQQGVKIILNLPVLFITVMELYSSTTEPNVISLFLAVLLLFSWTLNVLFEILSIYINERADLVKEAFALDVESFREGMKPKNFVNGILGKKDGEEKVDTDAAKENRHRRSLREKKARLDSERAEKKAAQKAEKERRKKEAKTEIKRKRKDWRKKKGDI